jgi:hypothetical protein
MNAALIAFLLLARPAEGPLEPGFRPLFNGKNLDGWTLVNGKGRGYVVEDGAIVCPVDGGGNLLTEEQFSDFVLRLEFKLTEGANNGIGIRAPLEGDIAYSGMEIQVLDHDSPRYQGHLKPAQYHGSIYDVVPAKTGFLKKVGEWNDEEISAVGRHIKVTLNAHVIVDASLDDVKDPAVLKRHPGLARTAGHVGFLGHNTRVEFRNLRIKPVVVK